MFSVSTSFSGTFSSSTKNRIRVLKVVVKTQIWLDSQNKRFQENHFFILSMYPKSQVRWAKTLTYLLRRCHLVFLSKFCPKHTKFLLYFYFWEDRMWLPHTSFLFWTRLEEMVFCYQNCSDLLWEKIVVVVVVPNIFSDL